MVDNAEAALAPVATADRQRFGSGKSGSRHVSQQAAATAEEDDDGEDAATRPLSLAGLAEHGHASALAARLRAGHDANDSDSSGETALHAAVGVSNLAIVKLLLLHNAAVDPPLSLCGWTPLHKAAARGNVAVLRLLLEFGADLRLRKADGSRALDLARRNDRHDCVALLEQALAADAPAATVFPPRVLAPLQLLCAVAIRKHFLQRLNTPVDGKADCVRISTALAGKISGLTVAVFFFFFRGVGNQHCLCRST